MKSISFLSVALLASITGVLVSGCGWLVRSENIGAVTAENVGAVTTKQYDFADFNSVEVGGAFTADISRADTYGVEITSTENVIKYVRVVKNGNTLKIGLEGLHLSFGSTVLEARITMPELVGLDMSGSTKGTVKGFTSAKDLRARVSGASSLDLDGESGKFACDISGSSSVNVRGKSTAADITLSGASSITVDMETGSFACVSSGSSRATGALTATSTTIRLDGASDARLVGSGGNVKITCSGSSDAALNGFSCGDADVDLSGSSHADMDVTGVLSVSLSGGSVLTYGGNPRLGDRIDIAGGSRLERR